MGYTHAMDVAEPDWPNFRCDAASVLALGKLDAYVILTYKNQHTITRE